MDGHAHGVAGLGGTAASQRYALWSRPLARLALGILSLFLVLAAWAPGMPAGQSAPPGTQMTVPVTPASADDPDLRLYRQVIERVKRGDNYYAAATDLQRANNYPVSPGLTVRLPTLAYGFVWLGPVGMEVLAVALLVAALVAVNRRFAIEPDGERFRLLGTALAFVGLSLAVRPTYAVLHEVWAAALLVLSLGLHRPQANRWLGAVFAAGAALAIRETALPFVMLMAAFALWRRSAREFVAWSGLVVLFAIVLAVHVHVAESFVRPGDPISPPWLVFSGLSGFLTKVIHSSSLGMLPARVAGPVAILAVFGWTGWNSPMGNFASLLTLGYAAAFMIAGRDNNFYWGLMIVPVLLMGLAMVPMAVRCLWQAATRPGHA